jgi:hypothetical protein
MRMGLVARMMRIDGIERWCLVFRVWSLGSRLKKDKQIGAYLICGSS